MTETTEFVSPKAPDWGKDFGIGKLWSEVAPGLWVGGTNDADTLATARESRWSSYGGAITDDAEIGPEQFEAVVTLYAWARPADWLVEEYRWGIYDSADHPVDLDDLRDAVVWAHKRWAGGKRTLIRCQAGLSRSPFITALVLIRDGMEVQEAVDTIRKARSGYCLSLNGSSSDGMFSKILKETPVEYWRD